MSLVFFELGAASLLLDLLDAGGIATAMPRLDFRLRLRCDGRVRGRPSPF